MAEATENTGSMEADGWKWKIIRKSGLISKSVNLAADFVSCRISGPVRRIEKRFATQAAVGEIIRADRWTSNETASFKRFLTTNRTGRTINIALLPSRQEQWFPLRVAVLFKSRAGIVFADKRWTANSWRFQCSLLWLTARNHGPLHLKTPYAHCSNDEKLPLYVIGKIPESRLRREGFLRRFNLFPSTYLRTYTYVYVYFQFDSTRFVSRVCVCVCCAYECWKNFSLQTILDG